MSVNCILAVHNTRDSYKNARPQEKDLVGHGTGANELFTGSRNPRCGTGGWFSQPQDYLRHYVQFTLIDGVSGEYVKRVDSNDEGMLENGRLFGHGTQLDRS